MLRDAYKHSHTTWTQDCKAKLNTTITISERFRSRDPIPTKSKKTGKITERFKRGTYGHEQIHVKGIRTGFERIVIKMEKAGACDRTWWTEAACKRDCLLVEDELKKKVLKYWRKEQAHKGIYWPEQESKLDIEPIDGVFPEAENENEK